MLLGFGTPLDELRAARAFPADAREQIAERLGMSLGGPRPDHLDDLLLDRATLTEASNEQLFGFADTNRDALADGLTLGDADGQIVRWTASGVHWGRSTDADGCGHLAVRMVSPSEFRVEVYRDAARTQLVAQGVRDTAEGEVLVDPAAGSGLALTVAVRYQPDRADITLVLMPRLAAWRHERLRVEWRARWPHQPASRRDAPGHRPGPRQARRSPRSDAQTERGCPRRRVRRVAAAAHLGRPAARAPGPVPPRSVRARPGLACGAPPSR